MGHLKMGFLLHFGGEGRSVVSSSIAYAPFLKKMCKVVQEFRIHLLNTIITCSSRISYTLIEYNYNLVNVNLITF